MLLPAKERHVVAHYSEHGDNASALAHDLGPVCVPLGADLTLEADVDCLFSEIELGLGPVEILIANAGMWPPDDVPLHKMTLKQWEGTLAVNLTSVFLCMRAFLQGIAKHQLADPAAVLVGSTAGLIGEAGHADYAAAKAGAIYGLTRSLKNEICRLAPRGRVNVVCPGWTFTPMTRLRRRSRENTAGVADDPPAQGRSGHDVAMAVVYLASSHLSGHVSGQVLTVSGGMEGRVLYDADEIDPKQA